MRRAVCAGDIGAARRRFVEGRLVESAIGCAMSYAGDRLCPRAAYAGIARRAGAGIGSSSVPGFWCTILPSGV
jgi:hypothetical protein